MGIFNSAVNALLRGFTTAFSWAPPVVSLTVISALVGVAMLWVFRKTSDQGRIRAVKRKVHAYLLELRVYADEPAVTWRAQKSLMGANLRYMGLALRPAVWLTIPIGLLLIHMEAFYGRAPLPAGQEAVVTARLAPGAAGETPRLVVPAGIEMTAPPVRVLDRNEISWRIRPHSSGELRLELSRGSVTKLVVAGGPARFVPGRRVQAGLAALWDPDEPPISAPGVEWVEVRYPEAHVKVFGIPVNWLLWFLLVSMVAALLFKKRFGVVL